MHSEAISYGNRITNITGGLSSSFELIYWRKKLLLKIEKVLMTNVYYFDQTFSFKPCFPIKQNATFKVAENV